MNSCYSKYPTTSFWIHNNSEATINFIGSVYKANTPPPHIMSNYFILKSGDSVLFRSIGFHKEGNPSNVFKEINFIPIDKRMNNPNDSLNWIKSIDSKGKPKYDLYVFSSDTKYDNGKTNKNCFNLYKYNNSSETYKIFQNSHGLKKGPSKYIDVEGYSILSKDHDEAYYHKRYIRQIKKDYGIEKDNQGTTNNSLNVKHVLFTTKNKISDNINENSILYLIQKDDERIKAIAFSTFTTRDSVLENTFLKNFIEDSVPKEIFTKSRVDSINFAGRCLFLGSHCRYIDSHNIGCPDLGQISWSIFRSENKALEYSNMSYLIAKNKFKVIETDSVDVVFEKVPSKALKIIYELENNYLTTYYITEKIRGRYISCVLSHYSNDIITNGLTPLIEEVMQLKE